MRLPNFDQFEPFTHLRQQMEARPQAHLSLVAIEKLEAVDVKEQAIDWQMTEAHLKAYEPPKREIIVSESEQFHIVQPSPPPGVTEEEVVAENVEEPQPAPLFMPEPEPVVIARKLPEAPTLRPVEKAKQRPDVRAKTSATPKRKPAVKRETKAYKAPNPHRITPKRMLQLGALVLVNIGVLYAVFVFIAHVNANKPSPKPSKPAPVVATQQPKPTPARPAPSSAAPAPVQAAPAQSKPVEAPAAPAPVATAPSQPAPPEKGLQLPKPATPSVAAPSPSPVPAAKTQVLDIPVKDAPSVQTSAPDTTIEMSPPSRWNSPEASSGETITAPPMKPSFTQGEVAPAEAPPAPPKPAEVLQEVPPEFITEQPFDDVRRKGGQRVGGW